MKTAVIIGHTGQDGYYLSEFLSSKGYRVIPYEYPNGIRACILDQIYLNKFILETKPDELYNLCGVDEDRKSFDFIRKVYRNVAEGTVNILETLKNYSPHTRFFNSCSSEIYGKTTGIFDENDTCTPKTPHASSKLFSKNLVRNYWEYYGIRGSSGILFNHESPRRNFTYVTRTISRSFAEIKMGMRDEFHLNNIGATKDWGFAGDYVEAMWMMLQSEYPEDFVISTGKSNSVLSFARSVCEVAELGDPLDYISYDMDIERGIVGNNKKIKEYLGWQPKHTMEDLARNMYEYDFKELNR